MFNILKRISDIIFSLASFIILLPLSLFLTFLLSCSLRGNPFFMQLRPGLNKYVFKVIKFRTMTDKKDSNGILLPDNLRMIPIGNIIRSLSLDELPQLINVLKGDMSFVGPRPLLPEYLPLYTEKQNRRHEVKPGITGWAQVNGRNAISWEEKFELDVWYVDNRSLSLDLKILWMTCKKVIKSEGISSKTSVTMEKFKGSKS